MATNPKSPGRATPASTTAYVVISPLNHDGDVYAIGDEAELTDAQAAPLLGHTVAKDGPAKPAA